MAKSTQTNYRVARTALESFDPDELKNVVRDGLVSMKMTEREDFVQALDEEMRRANLNIRTYLILIGIPRRSPEDVTPTEVGQFVRFLKLNVPRAMTAVDRVTARYGVFAEKRAHSEDPLAA